MNLKKNDKIIAVVGVIILIVAAIGIIIYTPEDGEEPIEPTEDKKTLFNVTVNERTIGPEEKTFSFGGFSLFLKSKSTVTEEELLMVAKDNLKSVKFNITYTDNKVGGLLGLLFKGMIGNDKLDVTIIDPDETEVVADTISGSGTVIIEFDGINPMIDTSQIEADSRSEAMEELEQRYESRWKDQPFQMTASHKVAETFRLLLRLRERIDTDSFDVGINYSYYDYDLEDSGIKVNGDNDDENNDDFNDLPITSHSITSMSGNSWI